MKKNIFFTKIIISFHEKNSVFTASCCYKILFLSWLCEILKLTATYIKIKSGVQG